MSKKESESMSPLALGLGVVAVLLIIGVVYVAVFLPGQTQTPSPQPSAQPSTSSISTAGNDTPAGLLPESALLTNQPSCATENTTPVLLFHDPYCPACIANEPVVNRFYTNFAQKTDVQYRFVAT
ncbi:MAG: hypothetical protein Q8P02_04130, partial [Candidatus Micrarchaeota archaeon]|nr:hypothetical protein [Candidatus Micrarchaeota archaeon]